MVHIVVKHLAAGYAGQSIKDRLGCLGGAVIHHHNLPEPSFQQLAHIDRQTLVRFQ